MPEQEDKSILDLILDEQKLDCRLCNEHPERAAEVEEAWEAIASGNLGPKAGFNTLCRLAKRKYGFTKVTVGKHINHTFDVTVTW